ncbi:MAG: EF-hand domain-containing protein [Candidatus Accumulibacter phosphatis]|uniref:EF hand n=3 Tax=Candidatus Accumulibacter TaxID=327159 RepID=A0A080M1N7_9PROT|nr:MULTISPECIES: EF-hand domain-containing protein [Candidatus Accumulibacter]KFB75163.1 MAG: EF hand [Candidatus Accumulibacter cognatus]MCC2868979.1 EF-hand domain-containing protein [Candidatus Accumulibacter phosphatis]MCM8581070.1 EF-hand domain-containing protein [Accumulibacter sp.]MCM8622316.1 EF-hand domain-containing protein [Accumulibacter sp.]MCQ1549315.1 EF-hand domain-containing protein [Candidatus Accumulibacter phosphatis]
MLKKTVCLWATTLCLAGGLAAAADPPPDNRATTSPGTASPGSRPPAGPGMARPTFADFDRNGDGKITQQEFHATRSERQAQRAGRPMRGMAGAPSFAEIDRDGDGSISPTEFAAHQRTEGRGPGPGMGGMGGARAQ